jgi:hypothetical protein
LKINSHRSFEHLSLFSLLLVAALGRPVSLRRATALSLAAAAAFLLFRFRPGLPRSAGLVFGQSGEGASMRHLALHIRPGAGRRKHREQFEKAHKFSPQQSTNSPVFLASSNGRLQHLAQRLALSLRLHIRQTLESTKSKQKRKKKSLAFTNLFEQDGDKVSPLFENRPRITRSKLAKKLLQISPLSTTKRKEKEEKQRLSDRHQQTTQDSNRQIGRHRSLPVVKLRTKSLQKRFSLRENKR